MLFYGVACLVWLVDQLSKYFVRKYIQIGDIIPLWGMEITHYENSGMAHSLFPGYARLFGFIALLFIVSVLYYRQKGAIKGALADISFGFLVGGAAGNGTDRFLFGQVTDFLTSRSGKGVLNLADHAIEIGVVLFLLSAIIEYVKSRE